jgi:hypothetical protein
MSEKGAEIVHLVPKTKEKSGEALAIPEALAPVAEYLQQRIVDARLIAQAGSEGTLRSLKDMTKSPEDIERFIQLLMSDGTTTRKDAETMIRTELERAASGISPMTDSELKTRAETDAIQATNLLAELSKENYGPVLAFLNEEIRDVSILKEQALGEKLLGLKHLLEAAQAENS